jgi:predicted transport protein
MSRGIALDQLVKHSIYQTFTGDNLVSLIPIYIVLVKRMVAVDVVNRKRRLKSVVVMEIADAIQHASLMIRNVAAVVHLGAE